MRRRSGSGPATLNYTLLCSMIHRSLARQAGMGLIELLIAMSVGLVIVGGMLSVLYSSRNTSLAQPGLHSCRTTSVLRDDVDQHHPGRGLLPESAHLALSTELPRIPRSPMPGKASLALPAPQRRATHSSCATKRAPRRHDGLQRPRQHLRRQPDAGNTFSVDAAGNLLCSVNGAAAQALAASVQNFQSSRVDTTPTARSIVTSPLTR